MVTICTTSITFNNCTLCPHCIYVFCVYLRTNSDLCHLQHKLIGFYSRNLTLYSPVVTICTTSLTFNNCTFCPHTVFICFVWIWEQTAIISLYNINWLVFITETECVYCAVRTGSLYIKHVNVSPQMVRVYANTSATNLFALYRVL